jgi:hypothetical protein
MRHVHRILIIGVIAILATACTAQESPGASASVPSVAPSASASPSTPASAPASTPAAQTSAPTPEPVPSDELGPFTCDFPIVEDATVPLANLVDVRIGEHDDYDRVVFEFEQGLPEITLDRAEPPFTQDASGMPIDVEGESFLRLTMRGGTKQTDDGTSSYDGPTEFSPDLDTLVHLVEGGDFEAQSTWYFGLDDDDVCARVIQLTADGAPRLVIDIED